MTRVTTWQSRRAFLRRCAAGVAGYGLGGCIGRGGVTRDGRRIVDVQLGWLIGANQVGEVVALRRGYFDDEGIAVRIHPGGPSIDGVAIVASGRYTAGEATSSPSVMLAVSQGIPIRCFAVAMQEHPYAYFSLPSAPVREPRDLVGKTVGIQPTGGVLLNALLAHNGIDAAAIRIQVVGSSLVPLLTGQVDVISGWTTNAASLRPLGEERVALRLWDAGIRLYAMPYYATIRVLEEDADVLAGFVRGAARGWADVHADPEGAVAMLVETYPVLRFDDELQAVREQMPYVFNARTAAEGWGAMTRDMWARQIDTYDRLGQFERAAPTVSDLMTTEILEATVDSRPRLGEVP